MLDIPIELPGSRKYRLECQLANAHGPLILETGNARVLNRETGDDLLSKAKMTASQYAIVLTIFSLCYAIFEVPSNWFVVSVLLIDPF